MATLISIIVGLIEGFNSVHKRAAPTASFERIKTDATLYYGEGWAPLGADIGTAKAQAKERAIQDLSENIHVVIEKSIVDALGPAPAPKKSGMELRVKAYTDIVAASIDVEDYALDYPRKKELGLHRRHFQGDPLRPAGERIHSEKKQIVEDHVERGLKFRREGKRCRGFEIVLAGPAPVGCRI